MSAPRNEAQLTARIVRQIQARYPDSWVLKVHGNGYQRIGVPDLLVCLNGRLIGLEVKHQKPGESVAKLLQRVRPEQWREIALLQKSGATAEVVWSVEQALHVIEQSQEGTQQ